MPIVSILAEKKVSGGLFTSTEFNTDQRFFYVSVNDPGDRLEIAQAWDKYRKEKGLSGWVNPVIFGRVLPIPKNYAEAWKIQQEETPQQSEEIPQTLSE